MVRPTGFEIESLVEIQDGRHVEIDRLANQIAFSGFLFLVIIVAVANVGYLVGSTTTATHGGCDGSGGMVGITRACV